MKKRQSKYDGMFTKGQQIGMWTVWSGHIIPGDKSYIEVQCQCGKRKAIDAYSLANGKSKSCGCKRTGEHARNYKGIGNISKTALLTSTNRRFSTPEEQNKLIELFSEQQGRCILTGVPLSIGQTGSAMSSDTWSGTNIISNSLSGNSSSATIGLIDPVKGYDINNVRWVAAEVSPLVNSVGISGAATMASSIVRETSQPTNTFQKLGFSKGVS